MFNNIMDFISSIGNWVYLIIFLAAFFECSAFFGMFMPGESSVVIAGFLSAQGYLEIKSCMIIVGLGAMFGDSTGYWLGRIVGRGYFKRHKRLIFLKEKHIEKVEYYFSRNGGKTIFLGKFIGFLRSFGPFTAGISRMSYREFLVYDISSCILWTLIFSSLGYFFGLSWQAIKKWSGRSGLFLFFILLVMVGFGRLYSILIKKYVDFSQWMQEKRYEISNSRLIKKFAEKHPNFINLIYKKLSPRGYWGIHLSVGLLLSIVFILTFGKITESVMANEPLAGLDHWVNERILYFRTPLVNTIMIIITQLGNQIFILPGSAIIIFYMFLKGKIDIIIGYITAIIGGGILNLVLKIAIQRERPISENTLAKVAGFSFPSGHAMLSMIFYGMIAYLLIREIKSLKLSLFIILSTAFIIFLIGFTRIYLQVHYLSDVIAGYIGGLFWLTINIIGLEIYKKKKEV